MDTPARSLSVPDQSAIYECVGATKDSQDASAEARARPSAFTQGATRAVAYRGSNLVGSGSAGTAGQGYSVALSADGNTALVGGHNDSGGVGAVWVFTRSGTSWSQQGGMLVGNGATGSSQQGFSVALSVDGNTALLGGLNDNSGAGAVWVFTRSGASWSQQGSKLVGSGAVGSAEQGFSVALSGDGATALVGGPHDSSNAGAAWVFVNPVGTGGGNGGGGGGNGGGGGSGGGGATTTTTTSFGDQSITLTTPSACVTTGGKLPVTLNSKSVAHKKAKLKFKLAQFFIDKGRKHTMRVKKTHKVHGKTLVVKKHGKPVFVKKTVYLPNATARHVPVTKSLSIAGLTPGTHTLRVKISYKTTIRKRGKRHTRIVTKTSKVTFTVC